MSTAARTQALELLEHARRARETLDFARAEALYAAATQADPGLAAAHHDRGGFYKLIGDLGRAEASLRIAHRLAPDDARTRHALGTVLLSQGRYREGWPLYDARHQVPELRLRKPTLPYPEWHGERLTGRSVLIFPEQGLGDQIQFARFAPWMQAQGADVTLLCHPSLARLFNQSFSLRVIAASGQVEFPDPDYWVMSGSLPGRAKLEPAHVPNAAYLQADASRQGVRGRIGIVTKGNPAHANDANRSIPTELAQALLAIPGAVSLHPEHTGASDFADTARLIAELDLVVSVDTSVAHLAGAMGKETWILLPRLMTDWRWQEHCDRTPWYPSARLVRQSEPGDWGPTVQSVVAALAQRRAGRDPSAGRPIG